MARRERDFYPTPEWATQVLRSRIAGISGSVLEPCSGEGHISAVLAGSGLVVLTNDLDPAMPAAHHRDMTRPESWTGIDVDWVVTNPPFSCAPAIVPLAFNHARIGCAMMLRLSYLEPCENRGHWLDEHPPSDLIVLPRISFTGDGKTDSVTCAWFVWRKSDYVSRTPQYPYSQSISFALPR